MRLGRYRMAWVVALAVATIATIAGLSLVTREVSRLEVRQAETLGEIAEAEVVRLALWRMDSWMTPRLAREAARPIGEYSSFYAPRGAVNRLLQTVPQGEVMSPSPLLISTPDWIPIYFESDDRGALTSPQIPEGNLRDLAEGQYLSEKALEQRKSSLDRLHQLISSAPQSLDACTTQAELANVVLEEAWRSQRRAPPPSAPSDGKIGLTRRNMKNEGESGRAAGLGGGAGAPAPPPAPASVQSDGPLGDLATRARASNEAQQVAQQAEAFVDDTILTKQARPATAAEAPSAAAQLPPPSSPIEVADAKDPEAGAPGRQTMAPSHESKLDAEVNDESATAEAPGSASSISPFVPAWLSTSPPELVFVRRVRESGRERIQGFLVDWPTLSTHLVAQITDIAVDARLVPSNAGMDAFGPARLASIPADLVADSFVTVAPAEVASGTTAVQFAWVAAILALVGAGAAAIAGVSFGDKQARFASSVTHELRTPLTTFQLYAEMLRDDMIPDASRRQECLDTLCRESKRLSHLVENVLSLARVERGAKPRQGPTTMGDAALRGVIEAIAHERAPASATTVSSTLTDATIRIDHDALSQIVANLIENAAKYGRAEDGTSVVAVAVTSEGSTLVITVRDRGTGIAPRHANAIWRPFDRAGAEGSNQPGLGLGLAVSRALADGIGGTLQLRPTPDGGAGACFELRVPGALA